MKDQLEDFIKTNRRDFDIYEPGENVWENIKIPGNKGFDLTYIWRIAAVFIVAIPLSIMIYKDSSTHLSITQNSDTTKKEIFIPELAEAEAFYTSQINEKKQELFGYESQCPGLEKDVNSDLSQLDSICSVLKKEMNTEIPNEEIIDAMIQNYRLKLEILEELLYQIKSKNNTDENAQNQYNL